jgi:hypothetical protein
MTGRSARGLPRCLMRTPSARPSMYQRALPRPSMTVGRGSDRAVSWHFVRAPSLETSQRWCTLADSRPRLRAVMVSTPSTRPVRTVRHPKLWKMGRRRSPVIRRTSPACHHVNTPQPNDVISARDPTTSERNSPSSAQPPSRDCTGPQWPRAATARAPRGRMRAAARGASQSPPRTGSTSARSPEVTSAHADTRV